MKITIKEETDWSEVEVDTKILVKDVEDGEWHERHFSKYEKGKIYAWISGLTSWTLVDEQSSHSDWKYVKLGDDSE